MFRQIFLVILFSISISSIVFAETREYITEGIYNMGDGETPMVAEQRALILAKQSAMEEAGVYLENYSEVNNYQLKKDEIRTISSGIIKTIILDKGKTIQDKGGIQFWVKIKSTVATDNINDMVTRIRQLSTAESFNEVEQKYAVLQTEHLENWGQSDKAKVNEKEWLANYWLDLGINQFLTKDYMHAFDSLTKSYDLNKNQAAIASLGNLNYELEDFYIAAKWYCALEKNENNLLKLALTYEKNGNDNYAKNVYEEILNKYNANNVMAWCKLGKIRQHFLEQYSGGSLKCYTDVLYCYEKSININPNYSPAYYYRGIVYQHTNNPYEAAQDYKKCLSLSDPADENYNDAKTRLQTLKDKYGIL